MSKLFSLMLCIPAIVFGEFDVDHAITPMPAYKNEVVKLTHSNFQGILQSDRPIIIDVYADWCGPCKKLSPIFEELCDQYGEQYLFMKMDSDKEDYLCHYFDIYGLPTLIFIKDGKVIDRTEGFMSKSKLETKIKSVFKE